MLSLCSCSDQSAGTLPASDLNGAWTIVKVRSIEIPSQQDPKPYIDFDYAQKTVSGNSGCNRMMGRFEVDTLHAGKLAFGPIATTRMGCPDMTLENNILEALSEVALYKKVKASKSTEQTSLRIALCSEQGERLLILEKNPAENANTGTAALKGAWAIRTVDGVAVEKTENTPFLAFDPAENLLYGNTGCNSISGSFQANDAGGMTLGEMASTLMLCADMSTETAILQALGKTESFRMTEQGELYLCDALGNAVLGLEKAPELLSDTPAQGDAL